MSKRNKTAGVLAGGLAVVAVGALPLTGVAAETGGATASGKAKTYKTKVLDDYYSPSSLKIKAGDTIKYKWGKDNGNPHNVTLEKGPKKVKKKDFKSATGSIGIKFNPVFKKKGTYDFVCTVHPGTMTQTVKVK
jgi:plastocyanin